MSPPVEMLTDDGYDLQFGTNVVGHIYFTKLVMTALLFLRLPRRELHTLSTRHLMVIGSVVWTITRSGTHPPEEKKPYDSLRPKKNGKLCLHRIEPIIEPRREKGNIIFSAELTRQYGSQGIISIALNPGAIKTELARHQVFHSNTSCMLLLELNFDICRTCSSTMYHMERSRSYTLELLQKEQKSAEG